MSTFIITTISQRVTRLILALVVFLVASTSVSAQYADLVNQLLKFNIGPADFLVNLQPPAENYAFNYQITQDTDGSIIAMKCSYDPTLVHPWTMHTYCDKPARKSQKKLLQQRVAKMAKTPVRMVENSVSIQKLSYYLIVTFSPDSTTLPPMYTYLKDCNGKAYINAATKRLEKITYENYRGTLIGTIKVSSMHHDIYVDVIDGSYRTIKEWREIRGKEKSHLKTYTETIDYSLYKKQ